MARSIATVAVFLGIGGKERFVDGDQLLALFGDPVMPIVALTSNGQPGHVARGGNSIFKIAPAGDKALIDEIEMLRDLPAV